MSGASILFAGTSLVLGAAGFALFLKLAEYADAAVVLRAADGFFGSLPRHDIPCSMALGATCRDDPGSGNHFYGLCIRAARGDMPSDERRFYRRPAFHARWLQMTM